MAIKFNRSQTFSTNGTVTAAGLHNLIDGTDIYQALITDQQSLTAVDIEDSILIADASLTAGDAPRKTTVSNLFDDALTGGTYTNLNLTGALTFGTSTGNRTVSTSATISSLTAGTTTSTAGIVTSGTIATLNSTTGTITNLSTTTSTFLGTITGSTNLINIGSGQIYKDASGNVGIGIAGPSVKLHVSGGTRSSIRNDSSGTTINEYSQTINYAGNGSYLVQNLVYGNGYCVTSANPAVGQIYEISTTSSSPIVFSTNGTEKIRIAPNGQIGIGGANYGISGQSLISGGSAAAPSWGWAGLTGFRNRIINGDMRIDQRNSGASQSITAASPSYSVDRFIVRPIGATVTGQRVTGTGSTQYVYQLTGAASVTQLQFEQRIESSNSYDLAGSNATLSVNLSNSLLTTANWILYYATATDNFAANTLISSGSWTISSTIARYNATISIPAAATTGLYLIIFVGAQTSGTFKIGDVQLEAGSTATEFERRPIGTELELCQRYYQKRISDAYATGVVGQAYSTTAAYGSVSFTQEMRASPNIGLASTGSASNTISFMSSAATHPATIGTIVATNIGVNGFQLSASGYTSGFTAGNASILYRNGSGEVWNASAEL